MKKTQSRLKLTVLLSGMLFTLACRLFSTVYSSGDLIYEDDFTDSNVAWETWDSPNESAASFYKGGLIMIISKPNLDVITTTGSQQSDVIIQVMAEKRYGPNDNVYGIVCRYLNDKNYYGFVISSDGYYGIIKVINGEYHLLSSDYMEYDEIINKGKEKNTISAECNGTILAFAINGVGKAIVSDSDLDFGKVGLLAGTFDNEGESAVLFDDFVIMAP